MPEDHERPLDRPESAATEPIAFIDPKEPASRTGTGTDEDGSAGAEGSAAESATETGAITGPDTEAEAVADPSVEKEWWDDPRMPWRGKPGRRDIALWIAFSLTGVYTLIMLPLRPVLIGGLPLLLVGLTGSRSGMVSIGALWAVGRADWWWVGLVIGSISLIKFDPIFFFAGRFWGRGLIDIFAGRSKRAARNADRAERLARRFSIAAIVLSYVVPIPSAVIFATLGAAGMRLRTFIAVDLLSALAINSLWLYLGHRLGQRAVDVVNVIARYSTWVSVALVAFILISAIWGARRKAARQAVSEAAQD